MTDRVKPRRWTIYGDRIIPIDPLGRKRSPEPVTTVINGPMLDVREKIDVESVSDHHALLEQLAGEMEDTAAAYRQMPPHRRGDCEAGFAACAALIRQALNTQEENP